MGCRHVVAQREGRWSRMRARLLVVDDDPDNVQGLLMILGRHYWVLGCESAQHALTALEALTPDLLVLDILMRPVDGVSCLELIRSRPHCRTIPAVAITAQAREVDRQRILAAGFQSVFAKPILDYPALLRSIECLLNPSSPDRGSARPEHQPIRLPSDAGHPVEDTDGQTDTQVQTSHGQP
jgi:CheY-like chemotaxis protein